MNAKKIKANSMQQGFITHSLLQENAATYNVQFTYKSNRAICPKSLQKAWEATLTQFPTLSGLFQKSSTSSDIYEFVPCNQKASIRQIQCDDITEAKTIINDLLNTPINPLTPPLCHLTLIKDTSENKHFIVFVAHHALLDFTFGITVLQHLFKGYHRPPALLPIQKKTNPCDRKKLSYRRGAKTYWKDICNRYHITGSTLLNKRVNPEELIKRVNMVLSTDETHQILGFTQTHPFSINTVIILAWALTYFTYNNESDICIGSIRKAPKEFTEGHPVEINNLPIFVSLKTNKKIVSLLQNVRKQQSAIRKYYQTTLSDLRHWHINMPADIFSSVIDFKYESANDALGTNKIHKSDTLDIRFNTHFPLFIEAFLDNGRLKLRINYKSRSYTKEEVKLFLSTIRHFILRIINNTTLPIKALPLCESLNHSSLSPVTKQVSSLASLDLYDELRKANADNLDAIAAEYNHQHISYQQLFTKVNEIILHFQQMKGLSKVALILDHSIDLVALLLACLKLKIPFIPIDPLLPTDRIRLYLSQSGASHAVIDNTEASTKLHGLTCQLIPRSHLTCCSSPHVIAKFKQQPNSIAYIIFTSGSTGIPKGIKIKHSSLTTTLLNFARKMNLHPKDRFLVHTSISFDIFLFEILLPLLKGSTLVLVNSKKNSSKTHQISHFLSKKKVNCIQVTPSLLKGLLALNCNLNDKFILSGGESLDKLVVKQVFKYSIKALWNFYGPTETTIWVSYCPIKKENAEITVGKPIPSAQFMVLNQYHQLLPKGALGELFIAGECLAQGYLDINLTQKAFIKVKPHNEIAIRAYATGDLATCSITGEYTLLDRKDNQIKHLGYRIELHEVEHYLSELAEINDACVLYDNEKDRLVAFIVMPQARSINHIKSSLSQFLPHYMVPEVLYNIPSLPLNQSGKVDTPTLMAIYRNKDLGTAVKGQPSNQEANLLKTITHIFQEALPQVKVNENSHFFDLGGDSLSAIALLNKLQNTLQIKLDFKLIYTYSTPKLLSHYFLSNFLFKNNNKAMTKLTKTDLQAYPLSPAQQRILFFKTLSQQQALYNLPVVFKITGNLQVKKLQQALTTLFKQERIFQIHIAQIGSQIMQVFGGKLPVLEVLHTDNANIELETLINTPLPLMESPLVRPCLVKLNDADVYYLAINFHHIIFDAWSTSCFFSQLSQLYNSADTSQLTRSRPNTPDFLDLTILEQQPCFQKTISKEIAYWQRVLNGAPKCTALPYDQHPTTSQVNEMPGATLKVTIDGINRILTQRCQQLRVSRFSILISAYCLFLHAHTHQEDLVIGTTVANRPFDEVLHAIGFFANTLPLRFKVKHSQTIDQLIVNSHKAITEYLSHQNAPFNEIVKACLQTRNTEIHPLFQTVFVYLSHKFECLQLERLGVQRLDAFTNTAKFDISFYVRPNEEALQLIIEYNTLKYHENSIKLFSEKYIQILRRVLQNPYQPLFQEPSNYDIFLSRQKIKAHTTSLLDLFSRVVKQHAEKTCISLGKDTMTYHELNHRSSQLARKLLKIGINKQQGIALLLPRSFDQVIAILATLKAGCYYIPIDTSTPHERVSTILENSQACLLVTTYALAEKCSTLKVSTLPIDQLEWEALGAVSQLSEPLPTDLAYVIFTSGTTGKPKGVMVSHHNVIRLLKTSEPLFKFSSDDIIPLFHSYAFDFSVWEMWSALLYGGELVIVPQKVSQDTEAFYALLEDKGVTILNQTPSAFYNLMYQQIQKAQKLTQLRLIIFGGEKLDYLNLQSWLEYYPIEKPKLVNMYGITEGTVHITYHFIRPDDIKSTTASKIGKPLSDMSLFILDDNLKPCPANKPGELYIYGDGVAQGYLNNKTLNDERFIPCPFASGLMYKTGDLVKWTSDKSILYLGRSDHQIKIRGYRVELAEVTHALKKISGVLTSYTTVLTRENGPPFIASFVTPTSQLHLACDHVWQRVFNHLYKQEEESLQPPDLFAGWNDSYQNKAIPLAEMQQWHANTLACIEEFSYEKLLEVGCGTGLLLLPLSQNAKKVYATDISKGSIDYTKRRLEKSSINTQNVTLLNQPANNFSQIPQNYFDVAVINSVIQYFPSLNYLTHVMDNLVNSLSDKGILFLGDIRDLRLLEDFHSSRVEHLFNQIPQSSLTYKNLALLLMRADKELVLAPQFFIQYGKQHPRIRGVQVRLKRGKYNNELSKYRYDVVMFVGKQYKLFSKADCLVLNHHKNTPDEVANLRKESDGKPILIERVRNQRLYHVKNKSTVKQGRCPEEICQQLTDLGESPIIMPNFDDPYLFDIILAPSHFVGHHHFILQSEILATHTANKPWHPTLNSYEIKKELTKIIPNYMIPGQLHIVPTIPVNQNGKADLESLTIFTKAFSKNTVTTDKKQLTAKEKALFDLCSKIIGVKHVDPAHSFFEVGGDSITAIQLISELKNQNYEVKLTDIFQSPSLYNLAQKATRSQPRALSEIDIDKECVFHFSPIHYWFFEQKLHELHHWNQGFLFDLPPKLNSQRFLEACKHALDSFPELAMRFIYARPSSYYIKHNGMKEPYRIIKTTVPDLSENLLQKHIINLQKEVNIDQGPILLCNLLTDEKNQLKKCILIAHHLYVDTVSWHLITTRISQVYNGAKFKVNTASLLELYRWNGVLHNSANFIFNFDYWLKNVQKWKNIATKAQLQKNCYQNVATTTLTLDLPTTTKINQHSEVVHCLLINSLAKWLNTTELTINLEHHGRERLIDTDWSQHTGWFTNLFPCYFNITAKQIETRLNTILTTLDNIPAHGLGFGALRYLHPDPYVRKSLSYDTYSGINLNYFGKLAQEKNNDVLWKGTSTKLPLRSKKNQRPCVIEINSWITDKKLTIEIEFVKEILPTHLDMDKLMHIFSQDITVVAQHLATISNELLPNATNPAKLALQTPLLQELNHLYADSLSEILPYCFHRLTWELLAEPDSMKGYIHALEETLRRHDSLQLTLCYDCQGQAHFRPLNKKKSRQFATIVASNTNFERYWHSPMKLDEDNPLIYILALPLSTRHFKFIMFYHELILDGWSLAKLFNEINNNYTSLQATKKLDGSTALSFQYYITSFQKNYNTPHHDLFLDRYLSKVNLSTLIPKAKLALPPKTFKAPTSYIFKINSEQTRQLKTIAKRYNVTLNTICLNLFGEAILHLQGEKSVSFGMLTSGRQNETIKEIDVIGACTQIIPFNYESPTSPNTSNALQQTQKTMIELQSNLISSPVTQQKIAKALSNRTYKYLYIFQNYPKLQSMFNDFSDIKLSNLTSTEVSNFPVTLRVMPLNSIEFKFTYIPALISKNVLYSLSSILKNMVTGLIDSTTPS